MCLTIQIHENGKVTMVQLMGFVEDKHYRSTLTL